METLTTISLHHTPAWADYRYIGHCCLLCDQHGKPLRLLYVPDSVITHNDEEHITYDCAELLAYYGFALSQLQEEKYHVYVGHCTYSLFTIYYRWL